jgi:predicted transcriptional regulator of viral defense system
MSTSPQDEILKLVRKGGVIRSRDLQSEGIPREHLSRLVSRGILLRTARGIYRLADQSVSSSVSLADLALRVPHGVVCLLSALRFHEIGTQSPFETWLAIDRKARKPNLDYPPLRVVRFSNEALTHGVETHRLDGVDVKVTSVERTIADCFKYRNKIGIDVAVEALKESYRSRKLDMNQLWRFAELNRVSKIVRPYIEAIV